MKYTFVRYGKLALTKQKGYKNKNFHSAPAPRGFYAFPLGYEELFLVGAMDKTQPKLHRSLPKVTKLDRFINDNVTYETEDIWQQKHKFTLSSKDLIWHHLDKYVKTKNVIERNKSWILTTVQVWSKAFKRSLMDHRAMSIKFFEGNKRQHELGKNGLYAIDHLEIFNIKKI